MSRLLRLQKIAYVFLAMVILTIDPIGISHAKTVQVPSGNRNADQPPIPSGPNRGRSDQGSFGGKYAKIYNLLRNDRKLKKKIKASAKRFGIDPVHIAGALVGEHTYNVDALDRIQTYYVKAIAYLGSDLTFKYGKEKVTKFVTRPQFARCQNQNSYDFVGLS